MNDAAEGRSVPFFEHFPPQNLFACIDFFYLLCPLNYLIAAQAALVFQGNKKPVFQLRKTGFVLVILSGIEPELPP